MKAYRVRWDKLDCPGEKTISIVSYNLASAESRVLLLDAAHHTGIEIVRCKPGSYEVLEVVS